MGVFPDNSHMPHILLIEDNPKLAQNIQVGLEESAYQLTWSATAADALIQLGQEAVDLILLDLGLPDRDGLDLIPDLKKSRADTPILILTARDQLDDRVAGLDLGGDDYLAKPFAFAELQARIRALLRRSQPVRTETLSKAGIDLDLRHRQMAVGPHQVDLAPREFDLLTYLLEHSDSVVSREMIARDVWQVRARATSINNVIDVHISRLREKLAEAGRPGLILTVRGVGFIIHANA
ncbi:MAG: two-component system copper resistance phosphate regulon response regulator CusR [Kiritimatiellia bacterium]